jgi:FMN phosphatase YigB (HAD superfamily)
MIFNTVIVDLGNVLFTLSSLDEKNRQLLSSICRTSSWFDYEKGLMTEEEAYMAVATETDGAFSQETITTVINQGRASLRVQTVLFDFLQTLKDSGHYRLFAMSNISKPDYEFIQFNFGHVLETLFKKVFPSHAYNDRKPNLSFFRRVIDEIGALPCQTLFIDDELDNVIAAQSIGIRSLLADKKNINTSLQLLYNLCNADPCGSGMAYLRRHAGRHISITSEGNEVKENFSQLLLFEATHDKSLVNYTTYNRLFHFFQVLFILMRNFY